MSNAEIRELETKKTNLAEQAQEIARQLTRAQKMREERKFIVLRENPDLLAAIIAVKIRKEGDTNVSAESENFVPVEGGAWNQTAWGEVQAKDIEPLLVSELWGGSREMYAATCATTGCIAGHAGVAAGYQMLVSEAAVQSMQDRLGGEQRPNYVLGAEEFLRPGNKRDEIPNVAADLLNLSDDQRSYLFSGERSHAEVLDALDTIAGGNYDWYPAWDDKLNDGNGANRIFRNNSEFVAYRELLFKEQQAEEARLEAEALADNNDDDEHDKVPF